MNPLENRTVKRTLGNAWFRWPAAIVLGYVLGFLLYLGGAETLGPRVFWLVILATAVFSAWTSWTKRTAATASTPRKRRRT